MEKYKDMTYTVRKDGLLMRRVSVNGNLQSLYAQTPAELYRKYINARNLNNQNKGLESNITVENWSTTWLETYKKNTVESATYNMYKGAIDLHINPTLGHIKLKALKESDVFFLMNKLSDRPRQRDIVLLTLKQILEKAIDNDYIYKNVTRSIKIKKHKAKEKKPLTKQDIEYIRLASENNYSCFMIYFMIYTGVRKEEVCALKWSDFDFQNRQIKIQRAIHWENNKSIVKDTKNTDSRIIPILDTIYNRLLEEYNKRKSDIVFPMKTNVNSFMTFSSADRTWDTALYNINKTKLKEEEKKNEDERDTSKIYFTYHILRHTFTCLLHKAGVPLKEAQQMTGHRDVKVLLNIYTHLDKEDISNASNLLNNYIQSV